MDRVVLRGLRARGHHGVLPRERIEGQPFLVDLTLSLDTRPAAADDDLAKTVHYGILAEQVVEIVQGEPVDLIETLAERIAATCLAHKVIHEVEVTVHKPEAPITVPFDDVSVTITRRRSEPLMGGRSKARPPLSGEVDMSGDPINQPMAGSEEEREKPAEMTLPRHRHAVLSLGGNLGKRLETIQAAVDALGDTPGTWVEAVSPVYETEPVGSGGQPSYLNAVVLVSTTLSPHALLERANAIEETYHRVRAERWGPRTLDVDIVAYQDVVSDDPLLTLPHPRAHQRAFVLAPWLDVEPAAELVGRGRVADLLQKVGRNGVELRGDLNLRLPR